MLQYCKEHGGYAEPSGGSYQRRRVSCEACGVCLGLRSILPSTFIVSRND
jgi:hypothetical protein